MNARHIAQEMVRHAGHRPYASRELPNGLELLLSVDIDNIILSISRPATRPSEDEITEWRAAFDVPARAERVDLANGTVLAWNGVLP